VVGTAMTTRNANKKIVFAVKAILRENNRERKKINFNVAKIF